MRTHGNNVHLIADIGGKLGHSESSRSWGSACYSASKLILIALRAAWRPGHLFAPWPVSPHSSHIMVCIRGQSFWLCPFGSSVPSTCDFAVQVGASVLWTCTRSSLAKRFCRSCCRIRCILFQYTRRLLSVRMRRTCCTRGIWSDSLARRMPRSLATSPRRALHEPWPQALPLSECPGLPRPVPSAMAEASASDMRARSPRLGLG
jgi:hypothetical protein